MVNYNFKLAFVTFCLLIPVKGDVTSLLGHKKRFGAGKLSQEIVEIRHGFPDVHDFFPNFVLKSRPLKMAGSVVDSIPFKKWTDEYFLSLDISGEENVSVETKKKELINSPAIGMNFQDFVRTYNTSDHYMVQPVPEYLGYVSAGITNLSLP